LFGPPHLTAHGLPEHGRKLHCGDGSRPQHPDDRLSFPVPPLRLPGDGPLRSAEADLMEVEIGVLAADVVEDAGDGAADPVVEALGGVGMGFAADIFTPGVANRVMRGEDGTVRQRLSIRRS
jgi:hypothetical protein